MYTLLVTILVIVSVLLVIAVLLQSSKGDGLAGSIAGGANLGSAFGARRTADFLSKITWWLGGILIGLSIIVNLFFLPGQSTVEESPANLSLDDPVASREDVIRWLIVALGEESEDAFIKAGEALGIPCSR